MAARAPVEPGRFATTDSHIHSHKRSDIERGVAYWIDRRRLIGPNTAVWDARFFAHRGVYGHRALQGLVILTKTHTAADVEHAAALAKHRGACAICAAF